MAAVVGALLIAVIVVVIVVVIRKRQEQQRDVYSPLLTESFKAPERAAYTPLPPTATAAPPPGMDTHPPTPTALRF